MNVTEAGLHPQKTDRTYTQNWILIGKNPENRHNNISLQIPAFARNLEFS
jgi:hypothetical protein